MKAEAFDLFLKQKRFDLIFKYLYVKNRENAFIKNAYLENIRAFNNFHEEEPSDNIPKESPDAFISSFDRLIDSIEKKGFNKKISQIPVGTNGEITDGAHRLAIAAALNKDIDIIEDTRTDLYDYKFFKHNGMDENIMDYGALEYVKINPNAYIVNLQSIISTDFDESVEKTLEKYGFIYYKKNIDITFNGLVNLKKLSYGSFWERESWIGNVENGFAGAVYHANNSFGKNPLRAYVFVCEKLSDVLAAKSEIRALFNIGNFCVHINDTREEAIALAQTYFNKNSLYMINHRPYQYEDSRYDGIIEDLKQTAKQNNIDISDVCASGSSPMDIAGIRPSDDLDFLYCGDQDFDIQTETLSNHDSELKYYPYGKQEIIQNPNYHLYYHGLKVISLDVLLKMKEKRAEKPKDIIDCKKIKQYLGYKKKFKIFIKIKDGKRRTIVLFGFIKIRYTKKGKK